MPGKKMGRPTDDPKTYDTRIRLSSNDVLLLNECCRVTGMTKADVIRLGIRKVYDGLKKE